MCRTVRSAGILANGSIDTLGGRTISISASRFWVVTKGEGLLTTPASRECNLTSARHRGRFWVPTVFSVCVQANDMSDDDRFDLIIIGSGSGNSIPDYLSGWKIAIVERDEVDQVEQPRLAQAAQLGVDVAAAHHDAGRGRVGAHGLGHAQRAVDVAGEWHGQAEQLGPVGVEEAARDLGQELVDQGRRRRQRRGQAVEAGRAGRQLLAVARQPEVRILAASDDVGQIVDVVTLKEIRRRAPAQLTTSPPSPGAVTARRRPLGVRRARREPIRRQR